MRCEYVKRYLPLYIDGIDDLNLKKKIEEHLNSCQECSSEYHLLRKIKENISQLEKVELPHDFHENTIKKLEKQKVRKKYNWGYTAKIAMIFVAGFLLGALLFNNNYNRFINYYTSSSEQKSSISAASKDKLTGGTPPGKSAGNIIQSAPDSSAVNSGETGSVAKNPNSSYIVNAGYNKKIIRNAYLAITVINLDLSYDKIVKDAEMLGGYVENSNIIQTDKKSCNILIRVPQKKLEFYLENIKKLGEVNQFSISGDDITREYMDISTRLKNKEIERDSLQKLMIKASSIDDILKIEEQLNRINTEIDQYTTQLKNWDILTQDASVEINMVEKSHSKINKFDIKSVINDLQNAVVRSINTILLIISKLIIGIAYLVVPFLILLIVYYVYKYIKEKHL